MLGRKGSVAFLVATLLLATGSTAAEQYPVFLIAARQRDNTVSSGTAFLTQNSQGRWLVSASHVVSSALPDAIFIRRRGGWERVQLFRADSSVDLAVLYPPGMLDTPPLKLRSASAQEGEPIVVAGFPLPDIVGFSEYTVVKGRVKSLDSTPGGIAGFWFIAPVGWGNSGGPVLDLQGQVLGIVAFRRRGSSEGYAVHAFFLSKLLGGR
jgi:S1-C subfamily serine protease